MLCWFVIAARCSAGLSSLRDDRRTGPRAGVRGGADTLGRGFSAEPQCAWRILRQVHIDAVFRAIGSFAVRFRWLVVLAWVAGAIAAVSLLPSLSSVTQNNNTKFLPASAPSEHAAELATPFGTSSLVPITVVAARSGSPLT